MALKEISRTPDCRWTEMELLGQYSEMRTALATKSFQLDEEYKNTRSRTKGARWPLSNGQECGCISGKGYSGSP